MLKGTLSLEFWTANGIFHPLVLLITYSAFFLLSIWILLHFLDSLELLSPLEDVLNSSDQSGYMSLQIHAQVSSPSCFCHDSQQYSIVAGWPVEEHHWGESQLTQLEPVWKEIYHCSVKPIWLKVNRCMT